MLGRLSDLKVMRQNRRAAKLVNGAVEELSKQLGGFLSGSEEGKLAGIVKDYLTVSGLSELTVEGVQVAALDSGILRNLTSRTDYVSRLQPLLALSEIIARGFDDVSSEDKARWLAATAVAFPISIYLTYSILAGELPGNGSLPSGNAESVNKILPALIYATAKDQLSAIETEKEAQDKERVARLEEGLRTISPSLRDLAFSKTRKDVGLTGVKNLYSRTFGEVYATAIVTVPSNQAPSMTYGVDKRAQLLFVLEYCARNLGCAARIVEEYGMLSGRSTLAEKPVIPNPSIFLSILRREVARSKEIERAIVETEGKLHNQAFIYYTEAGRTLSRLPLKTRPEMRIFLRGFKQRIDDCHSSFSVGQIPGSLREELVQFLTVAK